MSEEKAVPVKIGTQRVNANGKKTFVLSKGIEILLEGKKLNIPFNTAYFFDVDIARVKNEKAREYIQEKNIQRDIVAYTEAEVAE